MGIRGEIQEAVIQRHLNQLVAKHVNRIYRELKPVIEDIDATGLPKASATEQQDPQLNEGRLLMQCSERLAKTLLGRNGQARRTINDYSKQYKDRFAETSSPTEPISIEQSEEASRIPLLHSRPRIRPASSKGLKLFSCSTYSDRQVKSKELPSNSPTVAAKIVQFQCDYLPRFFGQPEELRKLPIKLQRTDRSPETQLEPTSSRTSILQFTKRYLPNFTIRSRAESSNSCQRRDQAEILRDRIKLLNTGVPVRVVRQQGYRKKYRDPRPFTNFFI